MAKKPVTELGKTVPSNLKFAIIVTVAVMWVAFFRSFVHDILLTEMADWVADLLVAVAASLAGYLMLLTYRKIMCRLRKIKV